MLLAQFRKKREELKVTLNQARDECLANKIAAASDPSQIWRTLADEGLTSSKSDLATKYFSTRELNDHFSSVASAHPCCTETRLEEIIAYSPVSVTTSFSFARINQSEVAEQLKSLLPKSSGKSPDGLPLKHLTKISAAILVFIALIFKHPLPPARTQRNGSKHL